jgi:hypothetical protein
MTKRTRSSVTNDIVWTIHEASTTFTEVSCTCKGTSSYTCYVYKDGSSESACRVHGSLTCGLQLD